MAHFTDCHTLEELKAEYHRLVLVHHPDRGGSTATMQTINAEYDEVHAKVKDIHTTATGETYTKETEDNAAEYRDLINALVNLGVSITIEVIGCFVWVSGDTKPVKGRLKELGLRWSHSKAMWYKSPDDYKRHGKKHYSIEHIRLMYETTERHEAERREREPIHA